MHEQRVPAFDDLLVSIRGGIPPARRRLALDPGLTTGYALFEGQTLSKSGQIQGEYKSLQQLFNNVEPEVVICEDYRVYAQRSKQHVNSALKTVRLIGGIEMLCFQWRVPLTFQMAQLAKGFVTDDKLRAWKFYKPSAVHANDAARHGCYYILFHGVTPRPDNKRHAGQNVG